jgi:hypothetical protein
LSDPNLYKEWDGWVQPKESDIFKLKDENCVYEKEINNGNEKVRVCMM